jgi:hypothetical protein
MNVGLKGGHGPVNRFLRHGEVVLFSASWALLMHAYTCHPTAVTEGLGSLGLRFLGFGSLELFYVMRVFEGFLKDRSG